MLETSVAVEEVDEAEKEFKSRFTLFNFSKCLDDMGKSGLAKVTDFCPVEVALRAEDIHITSLASLMSILVMAGVAFPEEEEVAVMLVVLLALEEYLPEEMSKDVTL